MNKQRRMIVVDLHLKRESIIQQGLSLITCIDEYTALYPKASQNPTQTKQADLFLLMFFLTHFANLSSFYNVKNNVFHSIYNLLYYFL